MRKMVLSMLVENTSGVLSRIAGLFSRRGYNIDSITAGVTNDPRITRITVVTSGDEDILEQIYKQLSKLQEVVCITELPAGESVTRELVLVKVEADAQERTQVISIADIFRANIVDVSVDTLMIEMTGNQNKIEAFLHLLDNYKILKIARTGITGLARGMVAQDTELYEKHKGEL